MADHENCDHDCEHCSQNHASEEECQAAARLEKTLAGMRHKIVVLSGKGGVGKSTVAVNLAFGLAAKGAKVGLLDVDLHGPSVPTMVGLKGENLAVHGKTLMPREVDGVKVVSLDFFLPDVNQAVIWRGPMKDGAIRQLLSDVAWGPLDYLVIDCPPGTGDEPLSVCQLVRGRDACAVVVTTPQEVSAADVRKSLNFCEQVGLVVAGVVENMSGFVCPHCGQVTYIFRQGAGETLADDAAVPFLGRIPLDPAVAEACDDGVPFLQAAKASPATAAFATVVDAIQSMNP